MALLTQQQLVYVQLTAAVEKLHKEHFSNCDDVSDVVEWCDDADVQRAVNKGEDLMQFLLNEL